MTVFDFKVLDELIDMVGIFISFTVSLVLGLYNVILPIFMFLFLVVLLIAVFLLFDIRRLMKDEGLRVANDKK